MSITIEEAVEEINKLESGTGTEFEGSNLNHLYKFLDENREPLSIREMEHHTESLTGYNNIDKILVSKY